MNEKELKFNDFIGSKCIENDDGWSKEVWDAAWEAALGFLEKKENE